MHFLFRSIKPKIQKYFAALYFICDLFIQSITTLSRQHTISGAVPRKGLTSPLTCRVARCCYLCAGAVYVVLFGSPTGSITLVSFLGEIPTALCCIIPSSLGKCRHSFKRHHLSVGVGTNRNDYFNWFVIGRIDRQSVYYQLVYHHSDNISDQRPEVNQALQRQHYYAFKTAVTIHLHQC